MSSYTCNSSPAYTLKGMGYLHQVVVVAVVVLQCRVGDVLRATTAMTMQMTYPTMNIMFGGKNTTPDSRSYTTVASMRQQQSL